MVEALRKAELVSEEDWQHIRLGRVSRTDRGVSAACAILTFDCYLQNNDVPAMLNSHLPSDVRCIAAMRIIPKLLARRLCSSRAYEYLMPAELFFPSAEFAAKLQQKRS